MWSRLVLVVGATAIAGCAGPLTTASALRLTPEQAVMNAAASPQGVSGVFEMTVRATGRAENRIFLNSQLDYRDPRNLSVVIDPDVAQELKDRFGADPDVYLKGKTIAVRGTALKTKIVFVDDDGPTDKYYFQTHLRVQGSRFLTVSGE